MRIWHPIPPFCLDKARLVAEHRELHGLYNIINRGCVGGYSKHPETKRWCGYLPALTQRHDMLVAEMERRGWSGHKTPLVITNEKVVWPETLEPVDGMKNKLAQKLLEKWGKI